MIRLTIKSDTCYTVPDSDLFEAFQRLAAYENLYDDLVANMVAIPQELGKLKAAGKEKTVRYREMLGQKLINNQIIALFERHGISFANVEDRVAGGKYNINRCRMPDKENSAAVSDYMKLRVEGIKRVINYFSYVILRIIL